MLHPPGHVLPRPMSLCRAEAGELGFLIDAIGPGTRALCALEPGERLHVLGPLGNGFDLGRPTPADRRRRDRHRTVPVRGPGARRGAGDPRLPLRASRRGGSARPGRRGRARPCSRHVPASATSRGTCSRAARSRCSRRFAPACRGRSSPGRRRWRVGTAPATAASSRSTGSFSASASTGRCCARHERPAPQRQRLPRRADCARRRSAARRLRHEDDHAGAARGQPAGADRRDRVRHAELDRPAGAGNRRVPRGDAPEARCPAASRLGLGRRLLRVGLRRYLRASRRERRRRGRSSSTSRARTSRRRRSPLPRSSRRAAHGRRSRSTRSSRPRPGTSPSLPGPSSRPEPTACRS